MQKKMKKEKNQKVRINFRSSYYSPIEGIPLTPNERYSSREAQSVLKSPVRRKKQVDYQL